jgi:predicted hydrolase (HD superfamily)
MTVTASLLERWKKAKEIGSDRQAAIALGVSHTAVQKWKDHGNASAAVIERMARDLGYQDKEIAVLLFESMSEAQAGDAESRKTFERLAKKVKALAVTAALLVSMHYAPTSSAVDSIHYAKRRRGAWRRAQRKGTRKNAAFVPMARKKAT